MSNKRRMVTEEVVADLPITPMLDMSFQLLAFFIMSFKPAPTEGQIAMTLPKEEGGPNSMQAPSLTDDKPVKYVVRVNAADNGTIKSMNVREDGSAVEPKDLGSDVANYRNELVSLNEKLKGKPGKLTVEIDEKLLQAYVVQLIDSGVRAGFADISPVPSDPKKR